MGRINLSIAANYDCQVVRFDEDFRRRSPEQLAAARASPVDGRLWHGVA